MNNYTASTGSAGNSFSILGVSMSCPLSFTHTPKLAAALVEAQKVIKAAAKSTENKFDKYHYSKLEDFYDTAKPVLAQLGLAIVFQVEECETLAGRTTKSGGTEQAVRVRISGTLVHSSGESQTVIGYGEGQDRADKAIYKAITGAKKYMLAGLLAIPTSDDPEADEKVGLSAKGGNVAKLDSQGNQQRKMPDWSKDQKEEAGGYTTSILGMLEQLHPGIGEAATKLKLWRDEHKYDQPADVLDALGAWKNELENRLAPGN